MPKYLHRRRDMCGQRAPLKTQIVQPNTLSRRLIFTNINNCEFPWKKKVSHAWHAPRLSLSTDRVDIFPIRAIMPYIPNLLPADNEQMFDAFVRQKVTTTANLRQRIAARLSDSTKNKTKV